MHLFRKFVAVLVCLQTILMVGLIAIVFRLHSDYELLSNQVIEHQWLWAVREISRDTEETVQAELLGRAQRLYSTERGKHGSLTIGELNRKPQSIENTLSTKLRTHHPSP